MDSLSEVAPDCSGLFSYDEEQGQSGNDRIEVRRICPRLASGHTGMNTRTHARTQILQLKANGTKQ